jgi:hypothetical protein
VTPASWPLRCTTGKYGFVIFVPETATGVPLFCVVGFIISIKEKARFFLVTFRTKDRRRFHLSPSDPLTILMTTFSQFHQVKYAKSRSKIKERWGDQWGHFVKLLPGPCRQKGKCTTVLVQNSPLQVNRFAPSDPPSSRK